MPTLEAAMPARKMPRPFEMHWGRGEIVEEATHLSQYHEACIQLMEYTDAENEGAFSIRFCHYNHRGAFQRSPLMVGEDDIEGLRQALKATPRLHDLLKRLVE
jgi:hypothetical protein